MKKKAITCSETSVLYIATWHYNPEDHGQNLRRCEGPKSRRKLNFARLCRYNGEAQAEAGRDVARVGWMLSNGVKLAKWQDGKLQRKSMKM
jgi:hypothetical protein